MPRRKDSEVIREALHRLVAERLLELDVEGFVDYGRKYPERESLFDGDLCTLINPACPDDLCYLPYGHKGADKGYHITGTVSYNYAIQFEFSDLAPQGTSRDRLITLGARRARLIEEIENGHHYVTTDVCMIPDCGCDGTPHP